MATPLVLTFDSDNWDAPQAVVVTGVQDKVYDDEPSSSFRVEVTLAGEGTCFDGISLGLAGRNERADKHLFLSNTAVSGATSASANAASLCVAGASRPGRFCATTRASPSAPPAGP